MQHRLFNWPPHQRRHSETRADVTKQTRSTATHKLRPPWNHSSFMSAFSRRHANCTRQAVQGSSKRRRDRRTRPPAKAKRRPPLSHSDLQQGMMRLRHNEQVVFTQQITVMVLRSEQHERHGYSSDIPPGSPVSPLNITID